VSTAAVTLCLRHKSSYPKVTFLPALAVYLLHVLEKCSITTEFLWILGCTQYFLEMKICYYFGCVDEKEKKKEKLVF